MVLEKTNKYDERINNLENLIISVILSLSFIYIMIRPITFLVNISNDVYFITIIFLYSIFWFSFIFSFGKATANVSERFINTLSPHIQKVIMPITQKINSYYLLLGIIAVIIVTHFAKFDYTYSIGTIALGFISHKLIPKIFKNKNIPK